MINYIRFTYHKDADLEAEIMRWPTFSDIGHLSKI